MGREPWLIFQGYWDKVYESHWSNTGKPLQKFPQNIGQKCRLNKLLVTEFFMDAKKKSQKVQLSMSLCASASTLYFGKFWYWCIILDHLPNVVYIYTQYTKLSRQTKYWSDANTCIGIDTIDMWIVAPTCSPNTVHTGKSTFTFTINMMLKTNIQIDSCLKKQISHIGLLAHTKCKAIS